MSHIFYNLTEDLVTLSAVNKPNLSIPPLGQIDLTVDQWRLYRRSWIALTRAKIIMPDDSGGGGNEPDNETIVLNSQGQLKAVTATGERIGVVKPDTTTITVDPDGTLHASAGGGGYEPDLSTIDIVEGKLHAKRAAANAYGTVKADEETIKVDSNAVLTVQYPTAAVNVLGLVKPDNKSIGVSNGEISVKIASSTQVGGVKIDGSSVTIDPDGTIHSHGGGGGGYEPDRETITLNDDSELEAMTATAEKLGIVKPDDSTIKVDAGVLTVVYPVATEADAGIVKPDGETIKINAGEISADIPIATEDAVGLVRPDGSTIVINAQSGVITATGSGGGGFQPDYMTIALNDNNALEAVLAAEDSAGIVQPDGSTITIEDGGIISATPPPQASDTVAGVVKIDGSTITIVEETGVISATPPPIATEAVTGLVKPDGLTVTIDLDGTLHANGDTPAYTLPIASESVLGGVKIDGSTVVIDGETGVLSATGGYAPDTVTIDVDGSNNLYAVSATENSQTGVQSKGIVKGDGTVTRAKDGVLYVNTATDETLGVVKPDTSTITIDEEGIISAVAVAGYEPDKVTIDLNNDGQLEAQTATSQKLGIVKPDGETIEIENGVIKAVVPIATEEIFGIVKPDGDTVTVNGGIISATAPLATTSTPGIVQPDGTTIQIFEGTNIYVPPASNEAMGVVKGDGQTVSITGGSISINLPIASESAPGAVQIDDTSIGIEESVIYAKKATSTDFGIVKPDGSTTHVNDGTISATAPTATGTTLGIVKPDEITLHVTQAGALSVIGGGGGAYLPDEETITLNGDNELTAMTATESSAGIVQPDGNTISIDEGVISALLPIATTSVAGMVRPDGNTISIDGNGIIQTVGSAAWQLAFHTAWATGAGTYLVGTLARGSVMRFRYSIYPSADSFDADVSEFNIWSRTDNVVLAHDMARNAASSNMSWIYDEATDSFDIFYSFEAGRHRLRDFFYQVVSGTFEKAGTFVENPPDQRVKIEVNNSSLIATEGIAGIVQPDGDTITITDGILTAVGGGTPYELPVATTEILGGVKSDGSSVTIDPDGTIHANGDTPAYELPTASETVLGGVKIDGSSITIAQDGTISATGGTPPSPYELPIASESVLGGVKIDEETVTIDPDTGVLSAIQPDPYELPIASDTVLGGVMVDDSSITITEGVISATQPDPYELPTASDTVLGGVKIDDSTITITEGVISAVQAEPYELPIATTSILGGVKVDGNTITAGSDGTIQAVQQPEPISPWLFCREINTVYSPTSGTYHIGDLERGEVVKLRHDVHFSGATNNADIWEYFIWSYKDGVTLIHDKHRAGDDLSYWFNSDTNKFEIYMVLQEGLPRHRDYYFQAVHPGEAGFVPATDLSPVADPPSPLLSINLGNSSNLATGDKWGYVKPDGSTISIADGVISAAQPEPYELPVASVLALGGVKAVEQDAEKSIPVGLDESEQLTVAVADADGGLGVVSIGDEEFDGVLTIDEDGVIAARKATDDFCGVVKPDGVTMSINGESGEITAVTATVSTVGIVQPDGASIQIDEGGIISTWQKVLDTTFPTTRNFHLGDLGVDSSIRLRAVTYTTNQQTTTESIEYGIWTDATGLHHDMPRNLKSRICYYHDPDTGDYGLYFRGGSVSEARFSFWSQVVTGVFTIDGASPASMPATTDLTAFTGVAAATSSSIGLVRTDNSTLAVAAGIISAVKATSDSLGIVKPDGDTISIDDQTGVISAVTATGDTLGIVKPDGESIIIEEGMISSTVTGLQPDMVTIDIQQGKLHAIGSRLTVNLSDQCNGSVLMFTGDFPRSATSMVYLNGLKLCNGTNYTITDSRLTLTTTAPATGSVLEVECF